MYTVQGKCSNFTKIILRRSFCTTKEKKNYCCKKANKKNSIVGRVFFQIFEQNTSKCLFVVYKMRISCKEIELNGIEFVCTNALRRNMCMDKYYIHIHISFFYESHLS